MRIQSKKLYDFLFEHNVDLTNQNAVNEAKKVYRKIYKKEWQIRNKELQTIIRLTLSKNELETISEMAKRQDLNLKAFIKKLVLHSVNHNQFISVIHLQIIRQNLGLFRSQLRCETEDQIQIKFEELDKYILKIIKGI